MVTMSAVAQRESQTYYSKGSTELATETALTVKRLEHRRKLTRTSTRTVIALVGLPARGKSFVARKMQFYLQFSGVDCRVFNVGKYRREAHAAYVAENPPLGKSETATARVKKGQCHADFFDSSNAQAKAVREKAAQLALDDMLKWLGEDEQNDSEDESERPVPDFSRHSSQSAATGIANLSYRQKERLAIFDATNSTQTRRKWLLEQCTNPNKTSGDPIGVVFLESVCDDEELLEENFRFKVSVSPDFQGMNREEALQDLRNRVRNYEAMYETISDDSMSYIKIFNLSSKLLVNHIYGRMAKELVPALMAWHIGTRPIFLCRPGQTISGLLTDGEDYVNRSRLNTSDPELLELMKQRQMRRSSFMRGDSLGPNGLKFKEDLFDFCYTESRNFAKKRASVRDMAHTGTSLSGLRPIYQGEGQVPGYQREELDGSLHNEPFPLRVFTSTMPRAADTVNWEDYEFPITQLSSLNPLDKGDYAGLEDAEDIRKMDPSWYERFEKYPYSTRFPGGENFRDLTARLKSVIIDIEQQVIPTLVVSHVSILQCLMSYFRNTDVEQCMTIEVPMHTVIKFTPVRGGGWMESQHPLYDSGTVENAGLSSSSSAESSSRIDLQ